MNQPFVDVVGVDTRLDLHQRTVFLTGTVKQETVSIVLIAAVFVAIKHGHVAPGSWLNLL